MVSIEEQPDPPDGTDPCEDVVGLSQREVIGYEGEQMFVNVVTVLGSYIFIC
jgi:hypothetical protein